MEEGEEEEVRDQVGEPAVVTAIAMEMGQDRDPTQNLVALH
jgi:hypothetical protein